MNNEEFNILNNIADILSSDPVLGATLLVSQNIDLDLFVYHLLDNYNEFKVFDKFNYRYSNPYYSFSCWTNGVWSSKVAYRSNIDEFIKRELHKIINEL